MAMTSWKISRAKLNVPLSSYPEKMVDENEKILLESRLLGGEVFSTNGGDSASRSVSGTC
jgi:hypothetical protein